MKTNTVETIIEDFRSGQNIFRRPSVELLVREVSRLQSRIAKLEEKLRDAKLENRWIPVSERLPETNMFNDHFSEMVLATNGRGDYYVSSYCGEQHIWTHPFIVGLNVTHWMPLPQPPKDGE